MTVTVAIKALNEADKIAAALESALRAVAPFGGRVVLADSGSSDDTLRIASAYPVTIVQLADPAQKCCGAGAQLAFQAVETPFFYLMDGDMVLRPDFLPAAMAWLDAHPDCAGVGGGVVELRLDNAEFQIRNAAMAREEHRRSGFVDRLDGGGLYRTDAVVALGYFANRNLRSYEEFDLAARLQAQGWRLARIDLAAVEHTGHGGGGYRLMLYRLSSGQMGGAGAVLRAALGTRRLGFVLRHLKQLWWLAVILAWWAAIPASLAFLPLWSAAALLLGPLLLLMVRRRSPALGLYSFCYWNLSAVAMLRALLTAQAPPERGVAVRRISGPREPA
jgi:glycosyltransferase involved in cell wall biosynthesis